MYFATGAVTGATGAVAIWGRGGRPATYPRVRLAAGTAIPAGGTLLFRYPTEADPCILVRLASGQLAAYSQVCTHLSCAVYYSKAESKLLCPCHRGAFDLVNGAPTGGPPTRPLPRIIVEQRGETLVAIRKEAR